MNRNGRTTSGRLLSALALLALLWPSSCTGWPIGPVSAGEIVQSETPRVSSPNVAEGDMAELVAGNSAFGFDLYQAERVREQGNLFYSPYSISLALAMTYAGARGLTATEMAQTMHYTLPQDRLHPTFNALDTALISADEADEEGFQINVANAIWGQQGYIFLPAFLDTLAANYGAGLRTVDYVQQTEAARRTINRWVSDETEERIQDLIPQGALNTLTRLVLTNAVYFNGQWVTPFEKDDTRDETFTLLDGSTVMVPMMHQKESMLYAEGDDYQAVALSYRGADMAMLFILPEAGRFAMAETEFTPEFLLSLVEGLRPQRVDLNVPKFSFESSLRLTDILIDMGMAHAFRGADFSGMTGDADLFISDVLHKAYVALDEEGTEAAASTAVIMQLSAVIDEEAVAMNLDHPFLFLIRDNRTGTVLFMGRVLNPA